MPVRWPRALGVVAVIALALSAVASIESSASAHSKRARSPASPQATTAIRHVVIIMQENRSFDSYFGTYPGADGIPGLAGHPGNVPCVVDPKRHKCVHPFHDRHDLNHGGPHGRAAMLADINGGKMNGYVAQQEQNRHWASMRPPDDVMGYHTGADIPNYWKYAHHFVLEDHMFEPVASWSLTSHLYLVSLWSADCSRHAPSSCRNNPDRPPNPPGWGRHPTSRPPIYAWTDLTYMLHKHHVSWRYYIFKGIEPDCESNARASCAPVTQGPKSYSIWNPLRYFDTVHHDHQLGNIRSLNAFFNAANRGTLPAVSWIVPNGPVSEHPGTSLVSRGQTYVTGLINTIMLSPEWSSTAIFVTWDDWGGMYDHIAPPPVDQNGYGLRPPALMISPYARAGYIDHQTLSFDAYAKFIEDDFLGGQRLDPATDGRPDPRTDVRENVSQLGDLTAEFDFNQTPLPPMTLPVHPRTDLIKP